jgi:hypothetical protein
LGSISSGVDASSGIGFDAAGNIISDAAGASGNGVDLAEVDVGTVAESGFGEVAG